MRFFANCRYTVDSVPLQDQLPEGDLKARIAQYHDLQLVLYLVDGSRPIGDLVPNATTASA